MKTITLDTIEIEDGTTTIEFRTAAIAWGYDETGAVDIAPGDDLTIEVPDEGTWLGEVLDVDGFTGEVWVELT